MRRKLIFGGAAVLLIGAWYAFRPERLFIDRTVNETFDVATASAAEANAAPIAILAGDFRSIAHETKGRATIYTAPDGGRTLRLTGFETSNGPDVRVYLVAAKDAPDNETVTRAGFVELGALKGNVGDQNYDVPADLNLDEYRAVTIWCRRFSVNFGTAPLGVQGTVSMADIPTVEVAEAMPAANPKAMLEGTFVSVAHETAGTATLYQLPDDQRVLRLTRFHTSNGPDVRVYLVAADDARDSETVTRAGFVELGKLKGNKGDQNYAVPGDLDLSKYRAVTIWCKRFSVNFGTAPLMQADA